MMGNLSGMKGLKVGRAKKRSVDKDGGIHGNCACSHQRKRPHDTKVEYLPRENGGPGDT